jgi:hypothetical protein
MENFIKHKLSDNGWLVYFCSFFSGRRAFVIGHRPLSANFRRPRFFMISASILRAGWGEILTRDNQWPLAGGPAMRVEFGREGKSFSAAAAVLPPERAEEGEKCPCI